MVLEDFRNIPFGLGQLASVYPHISAITNKATELVKHGTIIRLKKGLFVVSPDTSGEILVEGILANHIYGPSYISLETALRYYGMIPERILSVRSMTVKHTRCFANDVARFEYLHCDAHYFQIGINIVQEGGVSFLMASPTKALCDFLTTTPTPDLRFRHQLKTFLTENMRIEKESLKALNPLIVEECMAVSKKKNLLSNLIKIINDERDI